MISRLGAAVAAAVGVAAAAGFLVTGAHEDRATSQEVSIEFIRGIEGIDAIPLQNLEAVLRIQSRPEPPPPQANARAAAALTKLRMATTGDTKQPDTRQEMTTQEGS